jgi:hypothetical protein
MVSLTAIIFIFIFIIFVISYFTTNLSNNKKLDKYISVLSILSTFTVVTSFIYTLKQAESNALKRAQEEDNNLSVSFIAETQRNWIEIEKYFNDSYPYLAKLYSEMYPNHVTDLPVLTGAEFVHDKISEYHACQILFQTIENLVLTNRVVSVNDWGWGKIFYSWSGSATFKKHWEYSKNFYNINTQEFINNIVNKKMTMTDSYNYFNKN